MNKQELEAQFMQLIMGLQQSAWMLLGKGFSLNTMKANYSISASGLIPRRTFWKPDISTSCQRGRITPLILI